MSSSLCRLLPVWLHLGVGRSRGIAASVHVDSRLGRPRIPENEKFHTFYVTVNLLFAADHIPGVNNSRNEEAQRQDLQRIL